MDLTLELERLAKADHAADLRLRRVYNWTLAERNDLEEKQGHVCAVCRRPPVNIRLAMDHDHRFDRVRITVRGGRGSDFYSAHAIDPFGKEHIWVCGDKKEARRVVKMSLRRKSIRGLLCLNCNRGLQKFRDDPWRFRSAATYLENFAKTT